MTDNTTFYLTVAGCGLALYFLMPARVSTDILSFKLPSIDMIKNDLAQPPAIAQAPSNIPMTPMGPTIADSTQALVEANKLLLGGDIPNPPEIAAPPKAPPRIQRGGRSSSRYYVYYIDYVLRTI